MTDAFPFRCGDEIDLVGAVTEDRQLQSETVLVKWKVVEVEPRSEVPVIPLPVGHRAVRLHVHDVVKGLDHAALVDELDLRVPDAVERQSAHAVALHDESFIAPLQHQKDVSGEALLGPVDLRYVEENERPRQSQRLLAGPRARSRELLVPDCGCGRHQHRQHEQDQLFH